MEPKWYIVHVLSGFEHKAVLAIQERAEKNGLTKYFYEMVVPSESVVEVVKGKKVNQDKKFFPGYILIKMIVTEETWHLVKNIPRVSGFLGVNGRPQPVSQKEIESILKQIEEGSLTSKVSASFEVGENVKINDGPFESFVGSVEEVDSEKERLKVLVSIFGRSTPVDLDFTQVSKTN